MVTIFLLQLLDLYEFDLYVEDWEDNEEEGEYFKWQRVFRLSDLQGANLWNICYDQFINLAQVLDRMDIYTNDYIFEPLYDYWIEFGSYEEVMAIDLDDIKLEKWEDKPEWDLFAAQFIMSPRIFKILERITPNKFENIKEKLKNNWQKYWVDFDYKKLKRYL